MPSETLSKIKFNMGSDDCHGDNDGNQGWLKGYCKTYFEYTFGEIGERDLLTPVIEEVRNQSGCFRSLEIGANRGRAISDVLNSFRQHVPTDMPVVMTFIDCNPIQSAWIDFPEDIPENYTLRYFAGTEAGAYLETTNEQYAVIYGYSVEFLIQIHRYSRLEGTDHYYVPGFVHKLRQNVNRVLFPGGIMMFVPGRIPLGGKKDSTPALLPPEEFEDLSEYDDITILRRIPQSVT